MGRDRRKARDLRQGDRVAPAVSYTLMEVICQLERLKEKRAEVNIGHEHLCDEEFSGENIVDSLFSFPLSLPLLRRPSSFVCSFLPSLFFYFLHFRALLSPSIPYLSPFTFVHCSPCLPLSSDFPYSLTPFLSSQFLGISTPCPILFLLLLFSTSCTLAIGSAGIMASAMSSVEYDRLQ